MNPQDIIKLKEIDSKINNGLGTVCLKAIISCLEEGNIKAALILRQVEGDKTYNYPELESELLRIFGCRVHAQHNCDNWLCNGDYLPGE